jgi:hypothetical protein
MLKIAAIVTAAAFAALALAPAAQAEERDVMYRVGQDGMPVGEYSYVVTDDWGSYTICLDARCSGYMSVWEGSGVINGQGNTGYFEVPSIAKYVKLHNLRAYPA